MPAVALPNETVGTLPTLPPGGGDESLSVDTLVVYNDTRSADDTGTLTATNLSGLGMGAGGITYANFESLDPAKTEDRVELPGAGVAWVALEDTYFLAAAVPTRPIERIVFEPVLLDPGEAPLVFDARPVPAGGELAAGDEELARSLRAYLFTSGDALETTTFWGPKQYDRLAALPYGLEKSVQWGFLGFLALPLLAAL